MTYHLDCNPPLGGKTRYFGFSFGRCTSLRALSGPNPFESAALTTTVAAPSSHRSFKVPRLTPDEFKINIRSFMVFFFFFQLFWKDIKLLGYAAARFVNILLLIVLVCHLVLNKWCATGFCRGLFFVFFSSPFYTTACCGQLAALRERWEGEAEPRSLGPSGWTMSWKPLWGCVRQRGAADTGESLAGSFITLSDAVYIIMEPWCCHVRRYKSTIGWFFLF